MSVARIVIISGPPCTGKTFISELLSKKYNLPVIRRDRIRDIFSNIYGWNNRGLYLKNRVASQAVVFWVIELLSKRQQPFIVDSALWWKGDGCKLCALQKKLKFKALQFSLCTEGSMLWDRYKKRLFAGERHPGRIKYVDMDKLRDKILKGESSPPKLKGKIIKIDTTDFSKIKYKKIYREVENFLCLKPWQRILKRFSTR
jgi:hypothetical protein